MDCSKVKKALMRGEARVSSSEWKEHIENCPSCKVEERDYRGLKAASAGLSRLPLPVEDNLLEHKMRKAVMERISRQKGEARPAERIFSIPLKAAACFVATCLIAFFSYITIENGDVNPVREASLKGKEQGEELPGEKEAVAVFIRKNGGVTLTWKGIERGYWVLKSDNPSDFTSSRSEYVAGTTWRDKGGNNPGITYYKVLPGGKT